MEDDSLGYHGIMKILCNPHFIEYKVIKQKVSQLPLPWEILMMRQSVMLIAQMENLCLLQFPSQNRLFPPEGLYNPFHT